MPLATPFERAMSISALSSAGALFERAQTRLGASAERLASGNADFAKEAVALGQAKVQAEIAATVAKTVTQTTGALLDILI